MTAANWAGPSMALVPSIGFANGNGAIVGVDITLDADAEQAHYVGRIYWDDRGSHTVSSAGGKIHWLPGGSVTFAVVATLEIGIQDVDATAGPPPRGDGTFDVSGTLVAGVDTITSTTALATAMGSGTKTIAHGALIDVAWKLSVTSGAQSVKVRGSSAASSGAIPTAVLEAPAASYALSTSCPNVIIEADDGARGFLYGSFPFAAISLQGYDNNDTTKEYGNIVRFGTPVQIDGLWGIIAALTSAANFTMRIYSAPLSAPITVESVASDANTIGVAGGSGRLMYFPLDTIVTLAKDTDYCVAVTPDTTTTISLGYVDQATGNMAVMPLGAGCYGVSRNTIDEGTTAFSSISSGTRRFLCGVSVCGGDDGTGGGGSGIAKLVGMGGGLVG